MKYIQLIFGINNLNTNHFIMAESYESAIKLSKMKPEMVLQN